MNTETREIRTVDQLTDAEKQSGTWIPIAEKWAEKYVQKQPVSDADFRCIVAANERRLRRAESRHRSSGA